MGRPAPGRDTNGLDDLMTTPLQIQPNEYSSVFTPHSARAQHEGAIAVEMTHVLHTWIADVAQPTHNADAQETQGGQRSENEQGYLPTPHSTSQPG